MTSQWKEDLKKQEWEEDRHPGGDQAEQANWCICGTRRWTITEGC